MRILKSRLTGEPVSGSFLRQEDADAALGSSELLHVVDDKLGDQFGYGPPLSKTVPRRQLPDPSWRMAYEIKLRLLEREFLAACR